MKNRKLVRKKRENEKRNRIKSRPSSIRQRLYDDSIEFEFVAKKQSSNTTMIQRKAPHNFTHNYEAEPTLIWFNRIL